MTFVKLFLMTQLLVEFRSNRYKIFFYQVVSDCKNKVVVWCGEGGDSPLIMKSAFVKVITFVKLFLMIQLLVEFRSIRKCSKNWPICRLISQLIMNHWVSETITTYRSDLSLRQYTNMIADILATIYRILPLTMIW
jgi:hypothetical protein